MTRRGATLVEAVLGLALLAGLVGLAVSSLRFHGFSDRVVGKLDALQRIRLAEIRLRSELDTATALRHPREGDPVGAPVLVFTDGANQLSLVHRDPEGILKLVRRGSAPVELARGIDDLVVRQPIRGQAELTLRAVAEDGTTVSVVVSAFAANRIRGEGPLP